MAVPASFEECNLVLSRPREMDDDECGPPSVCKANAGGLPVIISCWKITAEELEEIQRTGRIWLYLYGESMQPAAISGHRPAITIAQ